MERAHPFSRFPHPLAILFSNMQAHHLCLLYQTPLELWTRSATFFQEGMARGEQCLYVAAQHTPEAVAAALCEHGISTASIESRRVIIQSADAVGLTTNHFSPNEAAAAWNSFAQTALAGGFKGLRLVVDMAWVFKSASSLAQLAEYEAQAERCFAAAPISALCHYNLRQFPEEMLLDALRTHPAVAVDGTIHDNLYYLPPEIFLRQDRRAQFHYYLNQLAPQAAPTLPDALAAPPAKASPWEAAHRKKPAAYLRVPDLSDDNATRRASMHWRWRLYCLGQLRVQRHDGTFVNWNVARGATKKIKTLFAYLLECGQAGAPMERLADLLWHDARDTEKALGRLYHTIHALRVALEPDLSNGRESRHVLIHQGRCFLWLPAEMWQDMTAFEQFCYRGERLLEAGDDENALGCYLAAEKLYGGDLLADIPLAYVEQTDDDWCWSRRYWLEEMYLKLLVGLAGIHRRRSALQEALSYGRQALALDPTNEAAHRELIQILHRAGRPDAVERQYRICEQVLLKHEHRAPESETTRLYNMLMPSSRRRKPQVNQRLAC